MEDLISFLIIMNIVLELSPCYTLPKPVLTAFNLRNSFWETCFVYPLQLSDKLTCWQESFLLSREISCIESSNIVVCVCHLLESALNPRRYEDSLG